MAFPSLVAPGARPRPQAAVPDASFLAYNGYTGGAGGRSSATYGASASAPLPTLEGSPALPTYCPPVNDNRKMCKNNCGRRVQPGLTKGLSEYDTCCKSCALFPGQGKHDANCEGRSVTLNTLGSRPVADRSLLVNNRTLGSSTGSSLMLLPVHTEDFVRTNPNDVNEVYSVGQKLGAGSFGVVRLATHRVSGEVRVCKTVDVLAGSISKNVIFQEITNMALLDHPNIVRVFEFFDDMGKGQLHQILETCSGGELQDKIDAVFRNGEAKYSQAFVIDVMKQAMRALAFMHSKNFMHKDLKPENIMLMNKNSSWIKIIDFGMAERFKEEQAVAEDVGGTLLFMAPEAFNKKLVHKSDIWSMGVIMYQMMCGALPFCAQWPPPPGKDEAWWQKETGKKILFEDPASNPTEIGSRSGISLINLMLKKRVAERPDAVQVLQDSWFKEGEEAIPTLSVGIVQCLGAYTHCSELKKAIFLVMAQQSSNFPMNELRQCFTYFDRGNEGTLSRAEVTQVLRFSGMDDQSASEIFQALDHHGDGYVHWTEFCAAAFCIKLSNTPEAIQAAYEFFDPHGMGISLDDFAHTLSFDEQSEAKWRAALPDLMKKVKVAKPLPKLFGQCFCSPERDEVVSKDEFCAYMTQKLQISSRGEDLFAVSG